jgi:hypothetical protein
MVLGNTIEAVVIAKSEAATGNTCTLDEVWLVKKYLHLLEMG